MISGLSVKIFHIVVFFLSRVEYLLSESSSILPVCRRENLRVVLLGTSRQYSCNV